MDKEGEERNGAEWKKAKKRERGKKEGHKRDTQTEKAAKGMQEWKKPKGLVSPAGSFRLSPAPECLIAKGKVIG